MNDASAEQAAAEGPLAAYRALRRAGELAHDPVQELAVEKLQTLHKRLVGYDPTFKPHWTDFFRGRGNPNDRASPPQGLYMFGGVGRGKSMLMDLFYRTAPVEKKRRVHFHAFMQEIHATIHRWRQARDERASDPMPPLAEGIAAGAWLLCFDEMQVTDVADAMLLGRLFQYLFNHGVVVVFTSNRPPDDLYKGGLNRELFLPFIAMIKEELDVLHLDGGTDYRLERLSHGRVYFQPLGEEADRSLEEVFNGLIEGAELVSEELTVQGRTIVTPLTARHVARFRFEELCARPLGAADYLALAERYHSIVLTGIPKLGPEKRNEAKRFVTLIDVLYENRVNLIASADAPPAALYPEGDGSFEFGRTASRLMEMQSEDYLIAPHGGQNGG
ncbi:cell division protein ZapE [Oceanibacterium hippocampi]|nr:cell division protein ZapE [Oceanibacterium hippocampi]